MQIRFRNFVMSRVGGIRAALWLLLASLAVFTVAGYPMYVIRPFREQQPAELARALWVLLHDKFILVPLFCLIAGPALMLWKRAGLISKVVLGSAIGISLIAAVSAWVNPEEIMFHAFGAPRSISIQEAKIDPNDMVIVVNVGGESRAYPIREMAYHHIVNDRLHELPYVVTY